MSIDPSQLANTSRLLFSIPLKPLQGDRFQPTGFPSLGAATYQTSQGLKLLVESTQSMANRLEATTWDFASNCPVAALHGISHVTVTRKGEFLTDSILESHRLNSPYILDKFTEPLKSALGGLEQGPINRRLLAETLFRYDVGSLLHGVFLSKKELAGGRLRVARALSAFIEATGVRVAASGGVKNDRVNLSNDTSTGFGMVPFARDEYTAETIVMHVNFDLAQIRGYGLGADAEQVLVLLGLYRLRKLLDGDLRLRTACDLEPISRTVTASRPDAYVLPGLAEIEAALAEALPRFKTGSGLSFVHTSVTYEAELKKGKESKASGAADTDDDLTET